MGDTHRHAARRVDHARVADRRMVARDLRPRNKLGPRVEMHRSDGMNTSVRSRDSLGSVISCLKRMAKNAQSLPTRPSCRVSVSRNAHYGFIATFDTAGELLFYHRCSARTRYG